jgi:hypothetical protein
MRAGSVSNSKAKYDRYDLRTFFLQSIGNLESEVRASIDARLRDVAFYAEYEVLYDKIATRLGSPTTNRLSAEKFPKIEHRQYVPGTQAKPEASVRRAAPISSPS